MTKKKYTYFITGGGTGGHIYPAVAVADALLADNDANDVYYIGNPKNLEYEIVNQKGYKFLGVNIQGMPRNAGFELVRWAFNLAFAVLKCRYYIFKYKPDIIFGTGGYVSAPALIAARECAKPYMLHDCDAQPGLVTRKLAPNAKCVSLAFESAKDFIKNDNCFINGNPVREEFKTLTKDEARKKLGLCNKMTLCIMGGSQGAKSINEAAVQILKKLSAEYDMQVIFQTGKNKFDDVIIKLKKIYPDYESDINLIVRPYFDEMAVVLKASDIAISRSGSLSLSELCASGVVPILVPFPHAAADHQRKNANFIVEQGAGISVEDEEISPELLLEKICSLNLNKMRENVTKLARYDGAEKIIEQLKNIVK